VAKKSLRAQLNQIRAWVRQGRTDAWIAHQLEVPAAELREFVRRHDLTADGEDTAEVDLRDEIEAEIEAAALAAEEENAEFEDGDSEDDEDDFDEDRDDEAEEPVTQDEGGDDAAADAGEAASADEEEAPRRRRRRRRGGRGRGGRAAKPLEATFDHGEKDGYGLWLDPAVADNPAYKAHWKDQRAVEVEITPEQIVIRRADSA
jgi:hypothetical protein